MFFDLLFVFSHVKVCRDIYIYIYSSGVIFPPVAKSFSEKLCTYLSTPYVCMYVCLYPHVYVYLYIYIFFF